jgi:predicted dehydrogenase/threonine dehydrogenase-like Zn-dependent dehydrogenase
MKQILFQKGHAIVAEVPVPVIGPNEVLVRVRVSCLSVGTEMSGVRSSAMPIWKKALQRPEKVVSTLKMASAMGVKHTWSLVQEKHDAVHPTGYSASGVVMDVGAKIHDISKGERVACAGAQCAYHAEYICVPRNLCTPLPSELDWENSSTVTLGAIALQGVRRAQPTIGENFVVIGLGILGQLTVQLLHVNGCRVIGVDLDRDRISLAKKLGMALGIHPDDDNYEQVARLTDGVGADGVIITAATPSDSVVSTAFKICRKKGRVVLVGDVGLHLDRADFYKKEIDFLISTSYGPGRYDNRYEEQGLDYPISYVRWTENRNMAEYLRLLSEKSVEVDPLISDRYPISEAPAAYASLSTGSTKSMMVLLTYPDSEAKPNHSLRLNPSISTVAGQIRVAVLGAGGFACATHLPNLRTLCKRFTLQALVTRTSHNAVAMAKRFGAVYASTDYLEVLSDPDVDAVIISTRHDLHGAMALEALKAGKHVLVEKPMVLSSDELDALDKFISGADEQTSPILLTGFNRRFSPYARRMAEILRGRSGPFMINYRMNAGYIPHDHWVHGSEGGGRNLGEACHIYDLFTYLANAEVSKVSAHSIVPQSHHYGRTDNFVATLSFTDGSVASLIYTALGARDYPKEKAEMFVDGKLAVLEDYKRLDVYGARGQALKTSIQDKGLKEELIVFAEAINSGEWPNPWWQQLQTARVTLLVEKLITSKKGHSGE